MMKLRREYNKDSFKVNPKQKFEDNSRSIMMIKLMRKKSKSAIKKDWKDSRKPMPKRKE